ncbi:Putative cell wall binding repeat 2 [Clostridium cavendishii DSM 21758]|uniref:Putative cell wall binding repeat 2 n=1 Tax=Clostridium cavendishii DSM 21758 TaxID=1121302 RepID=A0A1M6NA31_9CLOT|nr:cell wall-binding repeat-containing protein [Clostridium cavendishii]SHJ92517.1 Putative cell wall binding repeat 2 [Clostridium cavendishii DSM 21758]
MYSLFPCYKPTTNIVIDTANTTRILGETPFKFNNYVTKLLYPTPKVGWRPNAVILVPLTSYHYGLLASPVIHFPINAPLIFTNKDYLLQENFDEIIRLSPTGKNVPAQVLIVGPISTVIEVQLLNSGLSVTRITGNDPIIAATEAMEFRYSIPSASMEGNKNLMIVSAENFKEAIPAAYFSAHMGVPILFTYKNKLPEATKQKLIKYNDKNVFIIGSELIISNEVLNEIKDIVKGYVDRIDGNTPYDVAVNFSKYYSDEGMFGWNINEKNGWAFCFGNPDNWVYNLSSCIFAHIGKHSPLLYVEGAKIPRVTNDYILTLKPPQKEPPKPPFMHGYILGNYYQIPEEMQFYIEQLITV